MESSPVEDAFAQWQNALLNLLNSPQRVLAWQDRRYHFAHQIGQLLSNPSKTGADPVTGHVVYGVYVSGAGLLYVGQTGDARRRLRDLPVGESHHVAGTVPPETWERIVLVEWPKLLTSISAPEKAAAEQAGRQVCGLAMEYLLQVTYHPVMAGRRRTGTGQWVERNLDRSQSRGAISSGQFPELFGALRAAWDRLAQIPDAEPVAYLPTGRAIFPRLLLPAEPTATCVS